eukprot:gene6917-30898_t
MRRAFCLGATQCDALHWGNHNDERLPGAHPSATRCIGATTMRRATRCTQLANPMRSAALGRNTNADPRCLGATPM